MPLYQEHSRIPGICTLKLLVLDLSDTIFQVLIIQDKNTSFEWFNNWYLDIVFAFTFNVMLLMKLHK